MQQLIDDEAGATAIEYGLIAALVAVVLIAAMMALRNSMIGIYTILGTTLASVL